MAILILSILILSFLNSLIYSCHQGVEGGCKKSQSTWRSGRWGAGLLRDNKINHSFARIRSIGFYCLAWTGCSTGCSCYLREPSQCHNNGKPSLVPFKIRNQFLAKALGICQGVVMWRSLSLRGFLQRLAPEDLPLCKDHRDLDLLFLNRNSGDSFQSDPLQLASCCVSRRPKTIQTNFMKRLRVFPDHSSVSWLFSTQTFWLMLSWSYFDTWQGCPFWSRRSFDQSIYWSVSVIGATNVSILRFT